jgi:hypothetical protein
MKPGERIFITAFHCESCYGGYIAEIDCQTSTTGHPLKGNVANNQHCEINKEYPLPESIASPMHLPSNIDRFYMQAAISLKAKSYDASAMMSRKVLEVAVKNLDPDGNGGLYDRIEGLASTGKITQELKDWAHTIRTDGNEAAHEEEPVSPVFAKEILSFAEMFLMYTFTMPGMVEDRRPIEAE